MGTGWSSHRTFIDARRLEADLDSRYRIRKVPSAHAQFGRATGGVVTDDSLNAIIPLAHGK